jgi:hypothetical protein
VILGSREAKKAQLNLKTLAVCPGSLSGTQCKKEEPKQNKMAGLS